MCFNTSTKLLKTEFKLSLVIAGASCKNLSKLFAASSANCSTSKCFRLRVKINDFEVQVGVLEAMARVA